MKWRWLGLVALLCAGCWNTGTGEKVGTIIRLEKTGVFCQTWEAELIRGGLANGSGGFSTLFHFTIENRPDLVAKVQTYINQQTEVKVRYRGEGVTFCRSDSDNYFLTDVVPLAEVSR